MEKVMAYYGFSPEEMKKLQAPRCRLAERARYAR
jgi:hypothetical protein